MLVELSILGIALFILAVILAGFVWWIIQYVLVKLPERQQDILTRFTPCIVNQVMLEYGVLSTVQQKQIACERLRNIFNDEDIAQPGDAMIEVSIANALYKRKMQEANEWVEELKKDIVVQHDTAEMPVTPKEELWIL